VPGAVGLITLLAAVSVWNAAYALEIAAGSLDAKLLWAKAQYAGIVVVPVAVLVFALAHTGRQAWLARRRLAALAVVPAAWLVLAWTNEAHHLVWSAIDTPVQAWRPLDLEYGTGFYPGVLFSYLVLVASMTLIVAGSWSQRRYFRRQSYAILVAVGTPLLCNVLHLLAIAPWGLDLTPIGLAVTALCLALACGRWGLLDIAPVAREALVEHLRDGVLVIDARGHIVDCNRAAAPLLSCAIEDAVGRTATDVLPPGVGNADASSVVEIDGADGVRTYEVETVALPLGGATSGRLLLFNDVTARERLHVLLRSEALTDELTQVGNRRFFLDRLRLALEHAHRTDRPIGVVFLDLDDFKAVNDTLGHDVGDRVLAATARRLEACVRPQDVVARLGGDEFTVLLPDLDGRDAAVAVADRITAALDDGLDVDGRLVRVTASIGLHIATAEDATPESVLRAADQRMYATKEQRGA
jgi:diguanylate cyclase (GGDEF)-like protein